MSVVKTATLFGKGNTKLGDVLTFSLPAIKTCPGASELCKSVCYATQGFYRMKNVQDSLETSYKLSKRSDFSRRAIAELAKVPSGRMFRIHPSGDFYSVAYAKKWLTIMQGSPHITFWFYSRSYRKPSIREVLEQMSELPNVQAWFSCDQEMGEPKRVPPSVKLAYVMLSDDDVPSYEPDIIFRDYPMRSGVCKHVNGTIVCPVENGVTHTTCDKCKLCVRKALVPRMVVRQGPNSRIPLALVV